MSGQKEWQVGYRKPPEHSRFRKGQSGNSKGRPKGRKNYRDRFHDIINEKVVVNENGRRRKLSKFDVAVQQAINKAAGGDFRGIRMFLELYRHFSRDGDRAEPITIVMSKDDCNL
jgi:Family of unknown function (DUF5681)